MVLKDSEGDWGLCVAAWTGMQAGVPAIPPTRHRRGVPGKPGRPGYFKMHFLNLRTNEDASIVLPRGFTSVAGRKYTFSLPGLDVNLENGSIIVHSVKDGLVGDDSAYQMPQLVALSFVVSLLYLMVLPT